MESGELGHKVAALVDHLRGTDSDEIALADVASVTEVLIRTMRTFIRSIDESLYAEVRVLSELISETRGEIARLRHDDMKSEHIPRAGMELEAIVKSTEEATETIMNSAEEIMSADHSGSAETDQMVNDACMKIFEACSFQDITGQRVTKVVKTLTFIEERLANIKDNWDMEQYRKDEPEEAVDSEKALLQGPQLEGEGVEQTDVDAMFTNGASANGDASLNEAEAEAAVEMTCSAAPQEDDSDSSESTDDGSSDGGSSDGGSTEAGQDDVDALFD